MRPAIVYQKYLDYLLKFGNSRKLLNYFKSKEDFRKKRIHLKSTPYKITIDPGNVCNLECPGCHTGVKHPERMGSKMLSFQNFKTIFDQVEKDIFHLAMYNWGEPFLNKKLFEMVDYARQKKVGTTIHSNLNHFSAKMAEDCVKSGLMHLYLSIDGASQNVYEKYRKKGDLELVLENLKLLLETRNRMGSKYPYITWKYLKFSHNSEECETAKLQAKKMGVDSFEIFQASESLMDISDEAKQFIKDPVKFESLPERCNSLWSSMYIGPDGSVFPCSLAFRESEVFGNALQEEIPSIWNNEKYRNSRMFFTGNTEVELPVPCRNCKFYYHCMNLANSRIN
ncbi:MAG: SPASM domain-containing protein [Bacteroidetes bacterium]|nr:SPASM domain-containing protein [Bacteroidota bacterium]